MEPESGIRLSDTNRVLQMDGDGRCDVDEDGIGEWLRTAAAGIIAHSIIIPRLANGYIAQGKACYWGVVGGEKLQTRDFGDVKKEQDVLALAILALHGDGWQPVRESPCIRGQRIPLAEAALTA